MITEQDLIDLGFTKLHDNFLGKEIWGLGEEEIEIIDQAYRSHIFSYNMQTQTCTTYRNEYCIINRVCESKEEILQFIYCIKFLFNLTI